MKLVKFRVFFVFLQKGVGKNLQDAGEQFSAAVQRGAESVRDNLQGSQADATSKAKNAAGSAESKAKQGANEADSVGSKIANQAEDLKVCKPPDKLFNGSLYMFMNACQVHDSR